MTFTIADTSPRSQYTAAGGQTLFTVPFEYRAKADVKVQVDGALKTLNTDYTMTNPEVSGGGSITFTLAPGVDKIVTIYRDMPIARTSDQYTTGGQLPAVVIEASFDDVTMKMQQLERDLGRSVHMLPYDSGDVGDFVLPLPADRKNKYGFYFNAATGQPELFTSIGAQALSQSIIGSFLFPRTTAEVAAGVTPTFYYVPSHDAVMEVQPERYGFTGSNSAVDTTAFANALLVADQFNGVVALNLAFTANAQLTWPAGVGIVGRGRATSTITKGFNGDLFVSMPDEAWARGVGFLGAGATFTGRGLPITGTNGRQSLTNCRVFDFDGYCIEFEVSAGSQSSFQDCIISRYNSDDNGRYAIKISDTQQLTAVPRKFVNCESNGLDFIDFGGCNDTFVENCFFSGLRFTADSRGVNILGGRCRQTSDLTFNGAGNAWIGTDIFPNVIIASTTSNSVFGPNPVTGTITDNAMNVSNLIYGRSVSFTPTWAGTGSNPAIGNGTLRGEYARMGDSLEVKFEIVMGSTTTFGTGNWSLSLPTSVNPVSGITQIGAAQLSDDGTTIEAAFPLVAAGGNSVTLRVRGLAPSVSLVTNLIPWTWAVNDSIRASIHIIV